MVAVHVLSIQTHNMLRHLLRGVRGSRRRLELVMRVECCVYLVSLRVRIHHLGAPLQMLYPLFQLEVVGVHLRVRLLLLLLLLCGLYFAVLTDMEPSTGSHLRFGIIGNGRCHFEWRRKATMDSSCLRDWRRSGCEIYGLFVALVVGWCCERDGVEGRGFC
jgi:hypothetical protein